jgi:hypothetical protein
LAGRVQRRLATRVPTSGARSRDGGGAAPGILDVKRVMDAALYTYRPEPYDGPAVLFRAVDDDAPINSAADLGWSGLVRGGLEIHEVPGGEISILDPPYVDRLARELADALALASHEPPTAPVSPSAEAREPAMSSSHPAG